MKRAEFARNFHTTKCRCCGKGGCYVYSLNTYYAGDIMRNTGQYLMGSDCLDFEFSKENNNVSGIS